MTTHIEPQFQLLLEAWEKAKMVRGVDPRSVRTDRSGRVMHFIDYENRQSRYAWRKGRHGDAVHIDTKEDLNDGEN